MKILTLIALTLLGGCVACPAQGRYETSRRALELELSDVKRVNYERAVVIEIVAPEATRKPRIEQCFVLTSPRINEVLSAMGDRPSLTRGERVQLFWQELYYEHPTVPLAISKVYAATYSYFLLRQTEDADIDTETVKKNYLKINSLFNQYQKPKK